jgi:hypothetical protein
MGPAAIFDKSALQGLNIDEAVWFEAFLLANVVPVFYVETLADLEKPARANSTSEAEVARLADKTPANAAPNVHHRQLVLGELAGQRIEMDGRPIIGGGDVKQASDGTVGLHVAEFPETAALRRWQQHDFIAVERAVAKQWRAELAEHDPTRLIDLVKTILPAKTKISDLDQLKAFIDDFCTSPDPALLALAFDLLGVPGEYRTAAFHRWLSAQKPDFCDFAPYTTHVFKVDLLFYLGIERGFISPDRASNKADMAYTYYLPFANVFISGDRLHRRTVPLFVRDNQSYLDAKDFKAALGHFDAHYEALPDEIKQLGVMAFASYPPADVDNAITQLWDKHMRRDWREIACRIEANIGRPRDRDAEQATVAELNRKIEQAKGLDYESTPASTRDLDHMLLQRYVPTRKGKWRIVSEAVENAREHE